MKMEISYHPAKKGKLPSGWRILGPSASSLNMWYEHKEHVSHAWIQKWAQISFPPCLLCLWASVKYRSMSLAVKWGEWHPFHESNMNMNSTRKKPIIMALLGDERWTSWERSGRQVPEVKRRLSSQIFCVLCWEVPFLKTLTSLRKMVWKSLSGWLGGVMSHPVCSSQTNPQMPSLIVRTIQKRHMPQSEEIFMSLETEE